MNIVIILAGGTGTRLGAELPKQYIEVNGKPVIGYCLDRFLQCDRVDAIQIVAQEQWRDQIRSYMERFGEADKLRGFSQPGSNRQLSIWHGLQDVMNYADREACVMIHDAARPMLTEKFVRNCFEQMEGYDGVLPVLPMKDTVYYSEDGKQVTSLLKREAVFAGQAPEVFRLGKYYDANAALLPDEIMKINGSTEPAVLAGMNIRLIEGDEANFKVTTRADLNRLKQILSGD